MNRRTTVILYWSSTVLLALLMAALSVAYFTLPYFAEGMRHLGFPDYFRWVLGIAKGLGAVALVARIPPRLKTFVYDGFAIMFVCGAIAHPAAGDPPATALGGVIALALLIVSGVTRSKLVGAPRAEPHAGSWQPGQRSADGHGAMFASSPGSRE